jgi:eukaryotic-like serine/threonine-protein kinase
VDPERWRRVEDLYHRAVAVEESSRAEFLELCCGGDEQLQREVQSLLAREKAAARFIESPALEVAGKLVAHQQIAEGESGEQLTCGTGSHLAPGTKIGEYEIKSLLGSGGMGEVYRASDSRLGRDVAIKVLPQLFSADRVRLKRFEQEARAAAALSHPNILGVFQMGACEGAPYLVSELLEGETLRERIKRGPLALDQAVDYAIQVAHGLSAAHEKGIVHRDLKPENLFVTQDGRIKILDFGLAKLTQMPAASELGISATGTEPGLVMGTVGYMSPEQVRGQVTDNRTDIFAFGAILYEMLTGKRAFHKATPADTISAVLNEDPPSLSNVDPAIPSSLAQLVGRCLEKKREQRFQSVSELLPVLDGLSHKLRFLQPDVNTSPATAVPPSIGKAGSKAGGRAKGRRLVSAMGALIVVLLVAVAAWQWSRFRIERVQHKPAPAIKPRSSVAILGFKNLSGRPDVGWLSTALSEMLTTELSAGEKLRAVSGDDVARAKADLSVTDVDSLGADILARLSRNLASDFVVTGSYLDLGPKAREQIRLDLQLQDAAHGATIASISVTGRESELLDLVSRAGAQLRGKLGADPLSSTEAASVGASLPANLEAMRFYSEGLTKSRSFDFVGARGLFQKVVVSDPNFALGRSDLAETLESLGYDQRARDQAKKAHDLSGDLSREDRLVIEERYLSIGGQNEQKLKIDQSLTTLFPDNLDYGLDLVEAQRDVNKPGDAAATLEALRKLPPPAGQDPRIDLYESQVQSDLGHHKEAEMAARRTIAEATELGERTVVARAQFIEGQDLYVMGELDRAMPILNSARATYLAVGDKVAASVTDDDIAQLYYLQNDGARAKEHLRPAIAVAREAGSQSALRVGLNVIANILRAEGNLKEAGADYAEAERIAREEDEPPARTTPLNGMGWVAFDQGDLAKAREIFEKELELEAPPGQSPSDGGALTGLGIVLAARGDLAAARQRHEEALKAYQATSQRYRVTKEQMLIAALSIEEGNASQAESLVRQAAEEFQKEKSDYGEALAASVLVRALVAEGKAADAEAEIRDEADFATKSASIDAILDFTIAKGEADAAAGRLAQAKKELESAVGQARKYGFVPQEFNARLALAATEWKSGEKASARTHLASLKEDATAKGFLLVARKAAAAEKGMGANR